MQCTEEIKTLFQLGAEKIARPPKSNGLTDGPKKKMFVENLSTYFTE